MIVLTRLNGVAFALNPDLIERAESTPDTVITLVDTTKYIVRESLEEIVGLIRYFRASVIATAQAIEDDMNSPRPTAPAEAHPRAHLVPVPTGEG